MNIKFFVCKHYLGGYKNLLLTTTKENMDIAQKTLSVCNGGRVSFSETKWVVITDEFIAECVNDSGIISEADKNMLRRIEDSIIY